MRYRIFSFCLFVFASPAFAQDSASAFLKRNQSAFIATAPDNPLFNDAFWKARFFFFGENHGMAEPQAVDLALLNLMHRRGVRHYIAEVDAPKAWALNNYLRDGNEAWLDKVFRSWRADTAQWANKEYVQKFRDMRTFQQSLPQSRRLWVVGVDVPQDFALASEYLKWLTGFSPQDKMPVELTDLIRHLDTATHHRWLAPRALALRQKITAEKAKWKPGLGHYYEALQDLLYSFSHGSLRRDNVMFLNLREQITRHKWQGKKMYGFLGLYHTLQTAYNNNVPLAAYVKDSLAPGAVTSLVMYVLDGQTMLPYVKQLQQLIPKPQAEKMVAAAPGFPATGRYIPFNMSNDNGMMAVKEIGWLKSLSSPNSTHLFRLRGAGSPFANSKALAEVTGFQPLKMTAGRCTLDAFQYILLFRNPRPATPLE